MGRPKPKFSLDEFLEWEAEQPDRHEFHHGEVYAMVGGRRVHGIVTLNVAAGLKLALKGSPCAVFIESMKVQVGSDSIVYPDVFVTCDAADLRTDQIFTAPTLIVEVLSPSTQAYDRGHKFTLYRRLPTLVEYVLIDPETHEVQLFRKSDSGLFTVHDLTGAATIPLTSLGLELPADEVFEGLDPPLPFEIPAKS